LLEFDAAQWRFVWARVLGERITGGIVGRQRNRAIAFVRTVRAVFGVVAPQMFVQAAPISAHLLAMSAFALWAIGFVAAVETGKNKIEDEIFTCTVCVFNTSLCRRHIARIC
jgi:hypothetical protein